MKRMITIAALACAACLPSQAFAQSSDFENAFASRGVEARVSLRIPLGAMTDAPSSKPQLALVGRNYQSNTNAMDWALKRPGRDAGYTETRFAMTLSAQPEFMFNDRLVYFVQPDDPRLSDGVKTAGKIALGAGVLTVVVVGTLLLVFIATYDGDGT